ncbi:MAG TPA: fibronectin type III domain-containing protein [Kofleriaceae bacterium]
MEPTTSREAPPLGRQTGETIELAEAKLIIEHNATDEDTGFQGFVDGEAWKSLELRDSNGKLQLSTATKGNLRTLGLTELFFETNEPENAEVPIEELLALMPAGDYEFTAKTIDGLVAQGVATLSHTIPEAPEITAPAAGAVVSADLDLTITWNPSDTSQCGDDVTITHYQLIVEKADQPDHPGFGAETIDVRIPASVTSMRVPHEFLQPGTAYDFEVLAIEAGGNQTITAGEFSTL